MATQVAVVIPCYREQIDRVRSTVESAARTPNVNRVIVVDDGCNDETLDILHDEHACLDERAVTVLHLPENRGCSGALNAGIESLPEDSIVCRLDVGDHFWPEAKARQIDVVLSGDWRCSSSPHFDPVENRIWIPPSHWRKHIYNDSVFTGVTNVYHRSVWLEVGKHDESLMYSADWDFSMKVQYRIGWHMHDEPTCDAGMYVGGHSDRAQRDAKTKQRRIDDQADVALRGRILSHPDMYKHLSDPEWRRKRGLPPV